LTLPFALNVEGNLRVEPTNPYFDLNRPAPIEQTLRVESAREDFKLRAATVLEGPFEARLERLQPRVYSVLVRFVPARAAPGVRGISGRLSLESNDPAEPRKEVPLFALGHAEPAASVAQ
jgi:hypothetical protein